MEETTISKTARPRYTFNIALLASISVLMSLISNIISSRLSLFGPFAAPIGVFTFPIIYVVSDIISEVYGYRISRYIANTVTLSNLFFVTFISFILWILKPAAWCVDLNNSIKLVVGSSVRIVVASLVSAYLAGFANDVIFQRFKHVDGDAHFAKRKLLSSLAAEAIDTVVFISVAFIGTMPFSPFSEGGSIYSCITTMYVIQFVLKYSVEAITEPLAHMCANKLKKIEGPGAFEDRMKFNIFGFERKQPVAK